MRSCGLWTEEIITVIIFDLMSGTEPGYPKVWRIYPIFNETFYWQSGEIIKPTANLLQLLLPKIEIRNLIYREPTALEITHKRLFPSSRSPGSRSPGSRSGATKWIEPMALQTDIKIFFIN